MCVFGCALALCVHVHVHVCEMISLGQLKVCNTNCMYMNNHLHRTPQCTVYTLYMYVRTHMYNVHVHIHVIIMDITILIGIS